MLKHMFVPSDFDGMCIRTDTETKGSHVDTDATFLDDLERDVGEECTKLGPIEKVRRCHGFKPWRTYLNLLDYRISETHGRCCSSQVCHEWWRCALY